MKRDKSKLKFYVLITLVCIILIGSLILHAGGYHFLFYKNLKQMSSMHLFPLIYLLLYLISSFFPLPFLAFLGAVIFPFHEAFLLSMLGNILFFIIMFYLTRWLGRSYIDDYEKKHPNIRAFDSKFEKNSFLYVFILRIFFIIPPEAVNILAGLSKMKFKDYFISSILGTIPVVLVSILLVESYQTKQLSLFFVALVLFALFIILPFLLVKELRKYFKKKVSQE